MKSANKLLLSQFLPYRISALANRISNGLANQYSEKFGISVPEWRVIAILGEKKSCSSAHIVELTVMDKVAVSRAVKKLIDKKIIKRSINYQDSRRQDLLLTLQGNKLYEQIVPLALSYETSLFDKLSKAEKSSLWQILAKLDYEDD